MWVSETITYNILTETLQGYQNLTTILEHLSELSLSEEQSVQKVQKTRNIKNNHKFS